MRFPFNLGLDLLNDRWLVTALVNGIEEDEEESSSGSILSHRDACSPTLYSSVCRLCHHLLLLHPLALHNFRLLYTLAFRPTFLHHLWNLIVDTKRVSPVAGAAAAVPLLTVSTLSNIAVYCPSFCGLILLSHHTENGKMLFLITGHFKRNSNNSSRT